VKEKSVFFTVAFNDISGLAHHCHNWYTPIPFWVRKHRLEAELCVAINSSNIKGLASPPARGTVPIAKHASARDPHLEISTGFFWRC
jgi:hypothetical protein